MKDRYKIALIGYGKWGKVLLPHLDKRFDVTCVYGRTLGREGRFTNNLNEAFDSDAEAVVVATPIGHHYPIVKEALSRGKHVFCEKPLAIRPHYASELVDMAKNKGLVLLTDYTYTFSDKLWALSEIYIPDTINMTLGRNMNGNTQWKLTSHLLAILHMFTDIGKLGFVKGNINLKFNDGCVCGTLTSIPFQQEKVTEVEIIENGVHLLIRHLHRDNNLGYALDFFIKAMDGEVDCAWNMDCALKVTQVLDRLGANNGI